MKSIETARMKEGNGGAEEDESKGKGESTN